MRPSVTPETKAITPYLCLECSKAQRCHPREDRGEQFAEFDNVWDKSCRLGLFKQA